MRYSRCQGNLPRLWVGERLTGFVWLLDDEKPHASLHQPFINGAISFGIDVSSPHYREHRLAVIAECQKVGLALDQIAVARFLNLC